MLTLLCEPQWAHDVSEPCARWTLAGPCHVLHAVLLGLLMRKFLISNKLWTVLAANWAFSGVMSSRNFCLGVFWLKFGFLFKNTPSILFLGVWYTGQVIRKCCSSSTDSGQNGQKRRSLGVLGVVCRNFSMFKRLLDSRNLVNDCLILVFVISSRYFSRPISVLNIP